jgi:hypothetical protein
MSMALAMTEFAIRVSESGVRARYPSASEREVFLRAAALRAVKIVTPLAAFGFGTLDLHSSCMSKR